MNAFIVNKTFEDVRVLEDANIVISKQVFDVKYDPEGNVKRFKAWLVAKGFNQRHGVDYKKTFALMIETDSLRFFLAIVAIYDFECHQVDVNNAFTNSYLQYKIYMTP